MPEEGASRKEGESNWLFIIVAIAAARLVNKNLASPGFNPRVAIDNVFLLAAQHNDITSPTATSLQSRDPCG